MFGKQAELVTVGDLIRMRSGIGDFDIPDFDNDLLKDGTRVHPPSEAIKVVAEFPEKMNCETYNCTFACVPGTCGFYSSTNFVLAGLVLLKHAPEG